MSTLLSRLVQVRAASRRLNLLDEVAVNAVLRDVADATDARTDFILAENARDLALMEKSNPKYDRLRLTRQRLADIASDMRRVADLPSPLGRVLAQWERPNGMAISKVSVPFGVIGIIYEARPNVTFDVFSLCFKAGSACVLKGGSDAHYSNTAIVDVINSVLIKHGIDTDTVVLMPNDREVINELLTASGYVDLIIPRGSKGLIDFVRQNAKVPVIETGAGDVPHLLRPTPATWKRGATSCSTPRPAGCRVCNALDCLIVHRERLADLPALCAPLSGKDVVIYADGPALTALQGRLPRGAVAAGRRPELRHRVSRLQDGAEDRRLARRRPATHSPLLVAAQRVHRERRCRGTVRRFTREVDAACVYTNVSTAFTDGGQFGFGAEIGISTQKLHARGPMALPELTSLQIYHVTGNGQARK